MNSRKHFLLLLIALSFLRLEASNVDSLEKVLPEKKGKEKVDILVQLAKLNVRDNQQKTFDYGTDALELSKKLNYQEGIRDALLYMSTAYYLLSNYKMAIEYLEQVLEFHEKEKDTAKICDMLNKIAVNSRMTGDNVRALDYSFRALMLFEHIKDTNGVLSLMNNIGGIYRSQRDWTKAHEYYLRTYELATRINNETVIGSSSNNLGIIYRIKGEYEKAMEFYQKSLDYDIEHGNQQEIAKSYNNIGSLYNLMNKPEQAFEHINKALEISIRTGNLETLAVSHESLGDLYSGLQQYHKALQSYEKAFSLIRQTGNIHRLEHNLGNLVNINIKIDDYKTATEFYALLIHTKDSLHRLRTKAIVAEIEEKYELEKKTQEIERLSQENRITELKLNENRILAYSLAGLSFTIIIIALLLIQRGKLYTRQKSSELEQRLFRTQMNPHFIFNALNAIQSFIYKSEPAEAGKYLSNFARLIRLVLNNSREDYITLDNEIRTLEYYLQLQRLRFNNKFDFKINIDSSIYPEVMMVPPMLAQPFIENSIEHGIQHLSTKGTIEVSFELKNGYIYLKVVDNGIGINQSRLKNTEQYSKHESLALNITEERLRLLNRISKQRIELSIMELTDDNDQVKGTSITFNIPYKTTRDLMNN